MGFPHVMAISAAGVQKVATPTFDVASNSFTVDQSVNISCATPDVSIYYTTDGSDPTTSSDVYSAPINVTGPQTMEIIKAVAVKEGMDDSDVVEATYTISYLHLSAPIIKPASGSYSVDTEVTITAATGVTIYYTIDGSVPTTESLVYINPISVAGSGTAETIKAIAVEEQKKSSNIASATFAINYPQLSVPVMNPSGGSFSVDTDVTIMASPGATVYYTLDGSVPTIESSVYSAPISVVGSGTTKTIKAITVEDEMLNSSVANNTYTINYAQVSTPQISPIAGTYDDYQNATISSSTDGAVIHYTTDGSTPTSSSPLYTRAFSVPTSETIKAIATKSMMLDSEVSSDSIVLKVATPVISLASGTYNSDQTLTITCDTDGAVIHYTTNGSIPTASSASYTGEVSVSASETIKAIAVKTGMQNSEVANDAIVLEVAIPVISPASGTISCGTVVTLTTTTSGAAIYYTTDGSTPSGSSTLYNVSSPPTITSAETLQAIAIKTNYSNSSVASASFTSLPPITGQTCTFSDSGVSFNMVYVPGGLTFPTGTNDTGTATVAAAYWIGQIPVTYELWNAVYTWATTGGHGYTFANVGANGSNSSGPVTQPVTTINWRDAMVWSNAITEWYNATKGTNYGCVYKAGGIPIRDSRSSNAAHCDAVTQDTNAAGFRLLTSNEWELAARWHGNDATNTVNAYTNPYFTKGNSASGATAGYTNSAATKAVAWYGVTGTQAVALLAPNALGLYDMNGSVWEWNFDWYPGCAGSYRILRGGCWLDDASTMQVGHVDSYVQSGAGYPTNSSFNFGFRLARTAP